MVLNHIELILYSHHESQDLEYDLHQNSSVLTGLSIGLMSAAAVSISTCLSDIALNGIESVRLAFRLGVHVDRISQSLESYEADCTRESWAYVVTGISLEVIQEEITRFNEESVSFRQTEFQAFHSS